MDNTQPAMNTLDHYLQRFARLGVNKNRKQWTAVT